MEQEYSTTLKLKVNDRPVSVTFTAKTMEEIRAVVDNHRVITTTVSEILENPGKRRRRTKKLAGGKSMIEEIDEVFAETGKNEMSVREIRDRLMERGTYFGSASPYSAVYIALTQSPNYKRSGKGTFKRIK